MMNNGNIIEKKGQKQRPQFGHFARNKAHVLVRSSGGQYLSQIIRRKFIARHSEFKSRIPLSRQSEKEARSLRRRNRRPRIRYCPCSLSSAAEARSAASVSKAVWRHSKIELAAIERSKLNSRLRTRFERAIL